MKTLTAIFNPDADRLEEGADESLHKNFAKRTKKTLDVSLIEIPNNYRLLDWDKYNELIPDIEERGIKKRIKVSQRGDRYILEDGRLRLAAARKLGHETIKCVVLSDWRPKVERKKTPTEPLANEDELIEAAKAGDIEARNQIANHYYKAALAVGGRKRKGLDIADVDSLAFEAICKAIETFDPAKGKFSTWLGQITKGLITRTKRELDHQGQSTGLGSKPINFAAAAIQS